MKKGSYLINYSRGTVVDVDSLASALRSGHLAGAAVDVFPSEPDENGPGFVSPLQGCPNTILTPHIGGSTVEAQALIGNEVALKMIDCINTGSTEASVNFPHLSMNKRLESHHCIINIHKNVPGVLSQINTILSTVNVSKQQLETMGDIGYMLIAVDQEVSKEVKRKIQALSTSIRTRILF
jgi:D-3-phosphoglycerate dehydrogenase